jgi:hypothetical protein
MLGLLVAVAGMLMLGFVITGILELLGGEHTWGVLALTTVAALVLGGCIQTSWRLITGRPRKDGGLLSPPVIAFAGSGIAAMGMFGLIINGWQALPKAVLYIISGVSTAALACSRFRQQPRNTDAPPNPQATPDRGEPSLLERQ